MFSKLFQRLPLFLVLFVSLTTLRASALSPDPEQDTYGLGMGGAVAAIAGGTHAIEWNPAGIARATVPMAQMGLGFTPGTLNLQLNTSVLYPFQDGTVFALSQYSNFPNSPGASTSYIGSVGIPLNPSRDFLLGVNLKYLALGSGSGPSQIDGRGFGLDLGFSYDLRDPKGTEASFGLTVKNLDTEIRFNNTSEEPLNRAFVLAAAYQGFPDTRVEMDYEIVDQTLQSTPAEDRLRIGAERYFAQRFYSLRMGYDGLFNGDGAFSIGGGYHPAEPFEISYAMRVTPNNGQFTHSLALVYRFDKLFQEESAAKTGPEASSAEINLNRSAAAAEATPLVGEPISMAPLRKMSILAEPKVLNLLAEKSLTISFPGDDVTGINEWFLEVQGPGEESTTLTSGEGALPPKVEWNGLDGRGKPLPDGKYKIRLKTFGPQKEFLSDDFEAVEILTPKPHLGIEASTDYFSTKAPAKGRKAISFKVDSGTVPEVQSWNFEVLDALTGKMVFALKGKLRLPRVLRWNGKQPKGGELPDGNYLCVLSALDKFGNPFKSDPGQVTLDNTPPEVSLGGEGTLVNFASQGSFRFSAAATDKGGLQDWKLDLADEKGAVEKSFTGSGQTPSEISWDGKADNGNFLAPGSLVQAVFSAEDKAGNKTKSEPFWLQLDADTKGHGEQLTLNLATINFKSQSAFLDAKGRQDIQKAADSIKPYLNKSVMVVKGYASPEEKKNMVLLSRQRAVEVKKFLVKTLGIQPDEVFAVGYADKDPLAAKASVPGENDSPSRAVITLSTLP